MTALDYVKNCIKRDFPEDVSEILTLFVDENINRLRSAESAGQQNGSEVLEGEAAAGTEIIDVVYPFIALMQAYNQILKDEAVVREYCDTIVETAPEEMKEVLLSLQS